MYRKSLALLFIITSVNSSFAFGDNNPMHPKVTIDSEYLQNLEHFDPRTKANVLIRKKELDHLQNQEFKSISTSHMGWFVTIVSLFTAGIAGCCLSQGNGQTLLSAVSGFGLVGGLTITIVGSNETINHHEKKEQLRKEMDTIIGDDTSWKSK